MTLEQVLQLAKQLSLSDKVRLIEQLAPEIQRELPPTDSQARRSLWGLCADLGTAPSAEEIDEARRDVWANFPREDI
ncbi:hypothetical protein [Oscillatoria sp. HE19RPO]|uniref:hypothetical protein n=1 Tax=Oscillatoria sp. HE19RPO TaxID=2954806 RepID=UPI0020C4C05B|nr:hypothetical protein [Oscillatoria sp. HE19RPO]